jgi:hypothetical protein
MVPQNPALRIGGVPNDQFGEKTLSVEAMRPPPDEDRPPRMSWKSRLDRIAGLEWDWVERTAPVIGNERVRASMTGKRVSRVLGDGSVGNKMESRTWTER